MRRRVMFLMFAALVPMAAAAQTTDIVSETRAAIAQKDFARASQLVETYQGRNGSTPAGLLALSWIGRGALAADQLDLAQKAAEQTYDRAVAMLRTRPLDAEPQLPIALGASLEVQAQVLAKRGERSAGVLLLQQALSKYGKTSISARVQKNINLLSLEGTVAPALDLSESLGPRPVPLDRLKGKVVLLFFWAHWCPDCKRQGPILGALQERFGTDLAIVAPTQRYGYAARGATVGPAEELKYIDSVRREFYAPLLERPAPVSAANMQRYGVSTTPTLVLVDRAGIVRLYHPGQMDRAELEAAIRPLIEGRKKS